MHAFLLHILSIMAKRITASIILSILSITALSCLSAHHAAAATQQLTTVRVAAVVETGPVARQYQRTIVINQLTPPVVSALLPVLTDLKNYLNQMTGQEFTQGNNPSSGIVLLLSGSSGAPSEAAKALKGKVPGTFFIHADTNRLLIAANEQTGLSNGVYFYLELLGVRWLLPGDNWTIVPQKSNITLSMNLLVEPAFKLRHFSATGGFFANIWGRSYAGSVIAQNLWTAWQRRLRFGGSWGLGKQIGEAFLRDKNIVAILKQHPEYLAEINGKSTLYSNNGNINVLAKINAGNPDAVNLWCNWVISNGLLHAPIVPGSTIPVETSDGGGWSDKTASNLPGNGSPDDQNWYVVDQCAKKLAGQYPGASVAAMAYFDHVMWPSFPVEKNVVVMVEPYAFTGGTMSPEQFIAGWKQKATALSIADYWSIPDWAHDEPSLNYLTISNKLRNWYADNIHGAGVETTWSAGAIGLAHYEAAHMLWNLGINDAALRNDWYTQAFGPAKAPMRRMLERWANSFNLISAEIGTSFHDLAEAENLASGDPAVLARIDDFAKYVQYLRLRLELINDSKIADQPGLATTLIQYMLSINDSAMVHTTRNADLYSHPYPSVVSAFSLSNPSAPGAAWAGVKAPPSHKEILALIAKGMKDYTLPDWTPKAYTGAPTQLGANVPAQAGVWEASMPVVGPTDVFLKVQPGMTKIPLRVSRIVDNEVTISDLNGNIIFDQTVPALSSDSSVKWTQGRVTLQQLDVPASPGLYKILFPAYRRSSDGLLQLPDLEGGSNGAGVFSLPERSSFAKNLLLRPERIAETGSVSARECSGQWSKSDGRVQLPDA